MTRLRQFTDVDYRAIMRRLSRRSFRALGDVVREANRREMDVRAYVEERFIAAVERRAAAS